MRYVRLLSIFAMVLCGACASATLAEAAFGSAQSPALPTTPPFTQCPAVYLDASCTDLIVVTNSHPKGIVLRDPEVGYYDGIDDVLVGSRTNPAHPSARFTSASPAGVTTASGSTATESATPAGPFPPNAPSPRAWTEEPLGNGVENGYSYWGPDAELFGESEEAGTVIFPEPLQPGQYTYFSLESLEQRHGLRRQQT